jgi:molybdopterin-synthase adenylyltransferase
VELKLEAQKLLALPVQIIALEDGVLLKRGALETFIAGERAGEVLALILELAGNAGATRDELLAAFAAPDRPAVDGVIDSLLERKILKSKTEGEEEEGLAAAESSLDLFYWSFGQQSRDAVARMNQRKLSILGVNQISRQLAQALAATGVESVSVIDYPLLRNLRLFHEDGSLRADLWNLPAPVEYQAWADGLDRGMIDCLIATADFGGLHWMRQWNEVCVRHGIHFLPVVLQNLIGYVGPLVIPGETACFECVRGRQNSHFENPTSYRAAELAAFEGQAIAGFHPSMASVLGDIATIELTKFYGGGLPMRRTGTLIEVNLLQPAITTHRVLKLPRCPVCSPLLSRAAATARKSTFLPGNRVDS